MISKSTGRVQPPLPCLTRRQPGSAGGAPRPRREPGSQGQSGALPHLGPDAPGADRYGRKVRGLHERDGSARRRPGEAEEVLQAELGGLDAAHDSRQEWTVRGYTQ